MAKSILFPVEPTILKYARKYSGYSIEEISLKLKMETEQLQKYESEKCEIPFKHINRLAEIYKRPIVYFLLPKIPDDVVLPDDFRIVYDSSYKNDYSPKFYLSVRRARYVQSILQELWKGEAKYNFPKITLDTDVDKLGIWFRKQINFSFDKQIKWKDPFQALKEWKNALEQLNIFILQSNLSIDEISAFCLADQKPYVVMLNSKDHEYRKIFSLIHEVGHLLLKKSGVCNPEEMNNNSREYIEIEKFCNRFAASVILPLDDFMSNNDVQSLIKNKYSLWDENDLINISRHFKVSEEMLLRRFMSFGYLNEKQYGDWRKEYLKRTKDYLKPEQKKDLHIPRYRICISQNGKAFTSFVLDKFNSRMISFDAVSEILNISPRHISSLEKGI